MSEAAHAAEGLIGPNAILQLVPLIEQLGGPELVQDMLQKTRIALPDGSCMIPEQEAARFHRLLRECEPDRAPSLAAEAGRRTGRYILEHRIPGHAQRLLRVLPPQMSARLLSKAIAKNAWTFVGSGHFRAVSPWEFAISDNPVIRGEISETPLCVWHAAVFEELYRVLVHPAAHCFEAHCAAQSNHKTCRFALRLRP